MLLVSMCLISQNSLHSRSLPSTPIFFLPINSTPPGSTQPNLYPSDTRPQVRPLAAVRFVPMNAWSEEYVQWANRPLPDTRASAKRVSFAAQCCERDIIVDVTRLSDDFAARIKQQVREQTRWRRRVRFFVIGCSVCCLHPSSHPS